MELLRWRWSASVQITYELIIAVFFVVLDHPPARGDTEAVLRAADEAMYRNKDAARHASVSV